MSKGVTKENLMSLFPPALRKDERLMALGEDAAALLEQRALETDAARLYASIDTLPEAALDILARDFKVDWWDADYSIEEKRRTLKGSWKVHRTLGTKAAVETAIQAIYPKTTLEEWFEYGGEPYHFRLNIDITSDSGDVSRQKRVLERLNFYKSLRSHNDAVRYFLYPEKAWAAAGGVYMGSRAEVRTAVPAPPLRKPGGADSRAAAAGLFGSIERRTVKLDAGRVQAPTGRAAAGSAAGLFHSYQRIRVPVRNPATTI